MSVFISDVCPQVILPGLVGLVLIALWRVRVCPARKITPLDQAPSTDPINQVLLEALPHTIMKVDRDGTCQWSHVPKAVVPAWGKKDAAGSNLSELLPGDVACRALACHREAIATGMKQQYDYTVIVEGRVHYHEVCVVACDQHSAVSICRDVTERKTTEQTLRRYMAEREKARKRYEDQALELERQANELRVERMRAEQASRVKSELLAHVSHEIRTPMTAILGYADILRCTLREYETLDAARTIHRNGEYLLSIINDILDLSKIEAGKLELDKTECSPSNLVVDVATLMRVRAEAKGLSLRIEHDGLVPERMVTDPIRLRQILINLVGNAIKFTKTGSVRLILRLVTADGDEPRMQFEIADTGPGIAEAQLGQLFKPFAQAATSRTPAAGGTGLGLTISRRLAELMGGSITAHSVPGQGSTFVVMVPTGPLEGTGMLVAPPESVAFAASDGPPSLDRTVPRHCRILLAEDGPDNQRLISFLLRRAGATVTVVDDGKQAVELAMAGATGPPHHDAPAPFDVVLMDMQMPVMDGYTATTRLRENGYEGPIIALTAHAMKSERQRCLDAGCDDYATKPIDREALIDLIARYAPGPEAADESLTAVR